MRGFVSYPGYVVYNIYDLILTAKKIPHDIVYIHLVRKPEWYVKLNPRGQVPFIVHKGQPLPESALIFGETEYIGRMC